MPSVLARSLRAHTIEHNRTQSNERTNNLSNERTNNRTNRGVSMQLDVLPRAAHQLQKPVDDFVFADALIAHEQEMLPQGEVSPHGFEHVRVLRILVEHEVVGDEKGVVVGVRRQADGRRTDRQRAVLHRQQTS